VKRKLKEAYYVFSTSWTPFIPKKRETKIHICLFDIQEVLMTEFTESYFILLALYSVGVLYEASTKRFLS